MADIKEKLFKESLEAAQKEKAQKEKEQAKTETKEDQEITPEAEVSNNGAEYADREDKVAEDKAETADSDSSGETKAEDESTESDEGKKKKPIFGKKDKKDKKDEQIAELNEKILRNLAEFDNFRKRTEKEKSQMFEIGAKSIVEKILPTLDNFERALAAVPEELKDSSYVEGVEKIYKQLMTSLEEAGVKPIEALGAEFNPEFHNAVMHEDNDELGENVISAELQKGYMYRDSVVRHSMVKVAN